MKKKLIPFVVFTILLSVFILSNGHPSHANNEDYDWTVNADGTTVTITNYKSSNTDVTIPDELGGKTVTVIDKEVFLDKKLTSVILPSSLEIIGYRAFATFNQSIRPKNIALPSSLRIIGHSAFTNTRLDSITLPSGLTSIGDQAFAANNLKEVTLPSSLTYLGDSAFSYNQLTSVMLPFNLKYIGMASFASNRLTSITLPSSLTHIGPQAFANNQLKDITLPSGLVDVGIFAFINNKLTSVTVLNDATFIDTSAFISANNAPDFTIIGHSLSTAHIHANNKGYLFKPITYKVIYDGNGDIGGSISIDADEYERKKIVTVADNKDLLVKVGFTFDDWNSLADGTGVDYAVNDTFQMGEADVTLYAKWTVNNPIVTIDHVHAITDIHVPVSADAASINLPPTVAVTLSDTTTMSIPVTWDSGTPVFDGNSPGSYSFTGTLTLPTGVTNPLNLQAKVNVIVQPADADVTAPNWPGGGDLSLTSITTTSVQLSWPIATDNIAVISYRIYIDGVEKAIVRDHEQSYVVTGLKAQTTYHFSVQAYDAEGNASMALGKSATTLSPPVNPGGGGDGSGNSDSKPSYVPSSNTDLQELKVLLNGQMLTLTPEGSTFTMKTGASEVELFPTTAHSAAKVTLDGKPLVKGQKTQLHEGTNIFELTIEAENGTKKVYTVTIQRTSTEQVAPPIAPVEPDPVKPVKPVKFNDTPGHWAEDYIQQASALGILKGYTDGTFKPNNPLTRAQAVSIIVRALHLQADEASPFKDISNYAGETQAEIAAAYQFGIIKGSNSDFKPSDKITRAQIALMILRAYEYKTGTKYEAIKAPYSDFGSYDAEVINAISMLHELGIATGSEVKFNPSNQTTRAQAAKMFVHLLASLK